MNLIKQTKKINNLTFQQKCWLIYLFVSSLLYWFALRFIPMHNLSKSLGLANDNRLTSTLANKTQREHAKEIGNLMSRIANNTLWTCTCLNQALCVKRLLNYYKIPSVLYLGAVIDTQQNSNAGFKAHAWVGVHQDTVIGAPQHQDYDVVASFLSIGFS